ncbi:(2Fe-2S)-binding protein [Afifella sp. IM 167]|uniref:(2Fe-2S)-binding protein n=1 Tax=Afifella sp. IM 167 TaxID=2033586 RepID=UPI001CCAB7E1|nr:(2Fe-2S)-binding protein [Afifella sp. IM 167]MBZ8134505.1 sarcosine oxidase [Afifella sp. IM 167]
MFKRVEETAGTAITFSFEGKELTARAGDTVAAALLAAGERSLRASAVSASPRGPFCLMGVCFDCLVQIDGVPNRQACMVAVKEGMSVHRQDSEPEAVSL